MAVRCSIFQRRPQRRARKNHLRRQTIYFSKSFIGRDKPLLIVDHAEPKRHIVHRGIESLVLLAHQRAEAVLAAADGNGRVRFCLVCAPPLGAENEFKQDHQARCRLQTRKWSRLGRLFGHKPVRRDARTAAAPMSIRSGENCEPPCRQIWDQHRFDPVSLARVMSPASTAANMRSIASRYSLWIASTSLIRDAVGGLAERAFALERR